MECYYGLVKLQGVYQRILSVRFSSRYGMLPSVTGTGLSKPLSFSPLFIAVWNVTELLPCYTVLPRGLSVRFSSRYGMLLILCYTVTKICCIPFSPLFIAVWNVTLMISRNREVKPMTFSPLFIAVWNVTNQQNKKWAMAAHFQSAFHRGMECYSYQMLLQVSIVDKSFSPLFIAVWNVTPLGVFVLAWCPPLSVRFSSRYGMLRFRLLFILTKTSTFSPLFIAVWNVTQTAGRSYNKNNSFSPLFIAVWNVTVHVWR